MNAVALRAMRAELEKLADFEDEHGTGGPAFNDRKPSDYPAQWKEVLEREKKMRAELQKKAEEKPDSPAKTLVKSIAGMGVGMGAGYGAAHGINLAVKKVTGKGIPQSAAFKAIPLITGAAGLAYPYLHQATLGKMRQDHLQRQEKKSVSKNS